MEYLNDKERTVQENKTIEMLKKKGFMTEDGIIHIKVLTTEDEIKKDDLVITGEIEVIRGFWEHSPKTGEKKFRAVTVIPSCCVDHSNHEKLPWTNCGHEHVVEIGFGQNSRLKLMKV